MIILQKFGNTSPVQIANLLHCSFSSSRYQNTELCFTPNSRSFRQYIALLDPAMLVELNPHLGWSTSNIYAVEQHGRQSGLDDTAGSLLPSSSLPRHWKFV